MSVLRVAAVVLFVSASAHAEGRSFMVAVDMLTGAVRGLVNCESEEACLGALPYQQPLGSFIRQKYRVRDSERIDCRVPK